MSFGNDSSLWLFSVDTPFAGDERLPSALVWGEKCALSYVHQVVFCSLAFRVLFEARLWSYMPLVTLEFRAGFS